MANFIIKTGDQLQVTINPPAVVPQLISPMVLVGSSTNVLIGGQPICLQGDEIPPPLRGPLAYTSPPYVNGFGTLQLVIVPPDNLTVQTNNGGKPILLQGTTFQAMLNVTVPATAPPGVVPPSDPVPVKTGMAQFITTNVTVQAS
jgi:hypothetical protein